MLKVETVKKVEEKGSPIFSFNYKGKARNVQIGANKAVDHGHSWGTPISKTMVRHNGNYYLVAIDQNDTREYPKRFRLDKITDCSLNN